MEQERNCTPGNLSDVPRRGRGFMAPFIDVEVDGVMMTSLFESAVLFDGTSMEMVPVKRVYPLSFDTTAFCGSAMTSAANSKVQCREDEMIRHQRPCRNDDYSTSSNSPTNVSYLQDPRHIRDVHCLKNILWESTISNSNGSILGTPETSTMPATQAPQTWAAPIGGKEVRHCMAVKRLLLSTSPASEPIGLPLEVTTFVPFSRTVSAEFKQLSKNVGNTNCNDRFVGQDFDMHIKRGVAQVCNPTSVSIVVGYVVIIVNRIEHYSSSPSAVLSFGRDSSECKHAHDGDAPGSVTQSQN